MASSLLADECRYFVNMRCFERRNCLHNHNLLLISQNNLRKSAGNFHDNAHKLRAGKKGLRNGSDSCFERSTDDITAIDEYRG